MVDDTKSLFVGIKISRALQNELDSPAPGTKHYFDGGENKDYLQIIDMGEDKFIGRYIKKWLPGRWDHGRKPQYMQYRQINCSRPPHRGK